MNLIKDGAKFEDSGTRSLNHFYDPLHDRGLFGVNVASPDWALEDARNINRQKFSYQDARDYLYKALTLPNRQAREKNFGLTFQTLGQVIHHVQDMAQPQHVRNDAHCDAIFPCLIPGGLLGLYNPSLYENYTRDLGGNLPFTGYPSVTFDTARQFWTGQGQGLADFTNQNFLSAGTNFDPGKSATLPTPLRAKDYPKPEWNRQIQTRTWAELLAEEGISCNPNPLPGGGGGCGIECTGLPPQNAPPACLLSGEMDFYATNVVDHYNPAASGINPRASTLSIFDQDLVSTGKRQFALNRFNFNAVYPFLISKAVAYSAGLIDYFFRGRLEINDVSEIDNMLRIEVRNVSGASNTFKGGAFDLYYDGPNGERFKLPVAQNATLGELANNATVTLTAAKPRVSEVDLGKDSPLMLVYRGTIGKEEGIASVGMELPLSGFIVSPNYLPVDGISKRRHIYLEDGKWKLDPQVGLEAGNTDWKGWYINGKATKVLSWSGNSIYQNGKVLAAAPRDVLGAALTKDSDGRVWIVAIGYDESTEADIVYQRPTKRSESTAMYNPASAPDGWHQVFSYPRDALHYRPQSPWRFNGVGTQAQTLRGVKKTVTDVDRYGKPHQVEKGGVDRLLYTLRGGVENLGNLAGFTSVSTTDYVPVWKDVGCGTRELVQGTLTSTNKEQGEYIVGVDYRDSEVVFTKQSKSIDLQLIGKVVQTYNIFGNVSSGNCIAYMKSSFFDNTSDKTGFSRLLVNDQVVLDLLKFTAYNSSDHCELYGFRETSPTKATGNLLAQVYQATPYFVNMRDSIISYGDEKSDTRTDYSFIDSTGAEVNVNSAVSVKLSDEVSSASGLSSGSSPLEVQSQLFESGGSTSHPFTGSGCGIGNAYWVDGTVHTFSGGSTEGTYFRKGSWIVDTQGNLLVTQDKGTAYFGSNAGQPLGSYHYLTNSDLPSIIPAAASVSDPRYYPVGLIR